MRSAPALEAIVRVGQASRRQGHMSENKFGEIIKCVKMPNMLLKEKPDEIAGCLLLLPAFNRRTGATSTVAVNLRPSRTYPAGDSSRLPVPERSGETRRMARQSAGDRTGDGKESALEAAGRRRGLRRRLLRRPSTAFQQRSVAHDRNSLAPKNKTGKAESAYMRHVNMISSLNNLPPRKRGGLLRCDVIDELRSHGSGGDCRIRPSGPIRRPIGPGNRFHSLITAQMRARLLGQSGSSEFLRLRCVGASCSIRRHSMNQAVS
jgi:hypothetical protein